MEREQKKSLIYWHESKVSQGSLSCISAVVPESSPSTGQKMQAKEVR